MAEQYSAAILTNRNKSSKRVIISERVTKQLIPLIGRHRVVLINKGYDAQ